MEESGVSAMRYVSIGGEVLRVAIYAAAGVLGTDDVAVFRSFLKPHPAQHHRDGFSTKGARMA